MEAAASCGTLRNMPVYIARARIAWMYVRVTYGGVGWEEYGFARMARAPIRTRLKVRRGLGRARRARRGDRRGGPGVRGAGGVRGVA